MVGSATTILMRARHGRRLLCSRRTWRTLRRSLERQQWQVRPFSLYCSGRAQLTTDGSADYSDPFALSCKTLEDFEALSITISDLIIAKHGNHPLYAKFVESLVKGVCGPLRDVEVRKAASGLTALSNEKQKEQKDAAGGKKKKASKPALGANKSVGRADVGTYDEVLDDSGDYDDFVRAPSLPFRFA